MAKMPRQKPGRLEQDVGTPAWLLRLIEQSFGKIGLDPCASEKNHALDAPYFTKEQNGLEQSWKVEPGSIVYVNPPYANIAPWVSKAHGTQLYWGQTVVVLIPASVGSNWWREHVHGKAAVYFIPRIKFVGHAQAYPKDVAILVYGLPPGYYCPNVREGDEQIIDETTADPVN